MFAAENVFPQVPVRQWVVTFVHRFGSALNAHTHLHCCVADGVFSLAACRSPDRGRGSPRPRTPAALLRPPRLRQRKAARDGFDQPVRYALSKPLPCGQTEHTLTLLELLNRIATLVPPPHRHRQNGAGVLTPHAALRPRHRLRRTARNSDCGGDGAGPRSLAPRSPTRRASIYWARLLARIFETRSLTCPHCQGQRRLIAFVTKPTSASPPRRSCSTIAPRCRPKGEIRASSGALPPSPTIAQPLQAAAASVAVAQPTAHRFPPLRAQAPDTRPRARPSTQIVRLEFRSLRICHSISRRPDIIFSEPAT